MSKHPLFQLVLYRIREFTREPEAVFWAVLFPIVLSVGLGVAFRNRPAEVLVVATPVPAIAQSLRQEPGLAVDELDAEAARNALRIGKVVLVAEAGPDDTVVFRYDDTSPQGRTARMLADRAIQRAAGRADPVTVKDELLQEAGSRYIDFVVPGLVGLGIMSNAVWGLGFSIVDSRRRKLITRQFEARLVNHIPPRLHGGINANPDMVQEFKVVTSNFSASASEISVSASAEPVSFSSAVSNRRKWPGRE